MWSKWVHSFFGGVAKKSALDRRPSQRKLNGPDSEAAQNCGEVKVAQFDSTGSHSIIAEGAVLCLLIPLVCWLVLLPFFCGFVYLANHVRLSAYIKGTLHRERPYWVAHHRQTIRPTDRTDIPPNYPGQFNSVRRGGYKFNCEKRITHHPTEWVAYIQFTNIIIIITYFIAVAVHCKALLDSRWSANTYLPTYIRKRSVLWNLTPWTCTL